MMLDRYDPLHDVDEDRPPRRRAAQRVCDDESMDVCRPARPVATVDILGAL